MSRALVAEFVGTGLLLAVVVGSGIMGERLAAGIGGLALLANSLATGCGLYVLITMLGPLSGAHFNPAVTAVQCARGALPWRRWPGYAAAQFAGALAGVGSAHVMFDLPLLQASTHARNGFGQWSAEALATAGLVLVIAGGQRQAPARIPALVAAYIVAAYWFTASTSFANPAVTLARAFTDTFAGIALCDVPAFAVAQALGAAAGAVVARYLFAD